MSIYGAQPIRVLLVDDHRSVLWGLAKLIESARPTLELAAVATCHSEALLAAEKHRPHVVLLDLDLADKAALISYRSSRVRPQSSSLPACAIPRPCNVPLLKERAVSSTSPSQQS